jgi:hypothetical protein
MTVMARFVGWMIAGSVLACMPACGGIPFGAGDLLVDAETDGTTNFDASATSMESSDEAADGRSESSGDDTGAGIGGDGGASSGSDTGVSADEASASSGGDAGLSAGDASVTRGSDDAGVSSGDEASTNGGGDGSAATDGDAASSDGGDGGGSEAGPSCPSLDGLYCGDNGPNGETNTLYCCAGGILSVAQHCDAKGCAHGLSRGTDKCASQNACFDGTGLYCGGDGVAGCPNVLYSCSGQGNLTTNRKCPNKCVVAPAGQDDYCQ